MAFLGKNFTLVKNENFEAALKPFGKFEGGASVLDVQSTMRTCWSGTDFKPICLSDDKVKAITSYKSTQKISKDGDTYTYVSDNGDGDRVVTFKSGVEFDDIAGPEKIPVKTKYVVDGNTITQTVTSDKGTLIIKREYSANELVVTITSDKWEGVSKRYYKA